MKSKASAILIIVILSFPGNLFSQEAGKSEVNYESNVKKDALSFYLINTLGVGYKFSHGSGFYSGIIINADFGINNADIERSNTNINPDQVISSESNSETDGTAFSIDLSYLFMHDLIQEERIIIYWGIGPSIGFSYNNSEEDFSGEDYYDSNQKYEKIGYSVGARGVLGLEAKISNSVNLFAESSLFAKRTWTNQENENLTHIEQGNYITTKFETDTNIWYVGLNKIIIGVGIYL